QQTGPLLLLGQLVGRGRQFGQGRVDLVIDLLADVAQGGDGGGGGLGVLGGRRHQDVLGAHRRAVEHVLVAVEQVREDLVGGLGAGVLVPAQVGGDVLAQLGLADLEVGQ